MLLAGPDWVPRGAPGKLLRGAPGGKLPLLAIFLGYFQFYRGTEFGCLIFSTIFLSNSCTSTTTKAHIKDEYNCIQAIKTTSM